MQRSADSDGGRLCPPPTCHRRAPGFLYSPHVPLPPPPPVCTRCPDSGVGVTACSMTPATFRGGPSLHTPTAVLSPVCKVLQAGGCPLPALHIFTIRTVSLGHMHVHIHAHTQTHTRGHPSQPCSSPSAQLTGDSKVRLHRLSRQARLSFLSLYPAPVLGPFLRSLWCHSPRVPGG